MKKSQQFVATSLLGLLAALPTASWADAPAKHVPAKAPPRTPLTAVDSHVKSRGFTTAAKPPKPRVVTAVAPKVPTGPGVQHGIIFVGGAPGGKPVTRQPIGGKSALNPQPIPPGHGGPGDPVR